MDKSPKICRFWDFWLLQVRRCVMLMDTICALLGWVPMLVAGIMFIIVFFHPIEKEMAAMRADQTK